MQKSSVLVTSKEASKGVKFGKDQGLQAFVCGLGGHFQDFYSFRPPLTGFVLVGSDPDFLPFDEAVRIAVMPLARGGNFFPVNDLCM